MLTNWFVILTACSSEKSFDEINGIPVLKMGDKQGGGPSTERQSNYERTKHPK